MSLMGRVMGLFPFFHTTLIATNLILSLYTPTALFGLFFSIWLFPLMCWRLHQKIWPLKTGLSRIARKAYSPWWGSFQMQQLFLILPGLERILHVVPGLFSLWLRGWGAKVGKNVFWTPHTLILDRPLMNLGDNIVVGHRCSFSSHVISLNKTGELVLFVRPIVIGSGVFIGAGSDFGPGTEVAPNSQLPLESKFYANFKRTSIH
ncbi:MAG: acyl transferase [Chitinophagaceae bacterium]|nr:acyl transferase [Oligoflexus sp.]